MYIVDSILCILFAGFVIWPQVHTGIAWFGDSEHMVEREKTPGHFWTIIALWAFIGIAANPIILASNLGFR